MSIQKISRQKHEYSKNILAKNMNTQKKYLWKNKSIIHCLYICYSNTYICRRYHQYKMVTIGKLKTGSAVLLEWLLILSTEENMDIYLEDRLSWVICWA